MIEFSWIFKKKECMFFLDQLVESESDEIFAVETIRQSILFLWDFYFYVVLQKVFLPYFIFFCFFFAYAPFVFSGENRKEKEAIKGQNLVLALINILYSSYALAREIWQIKSQGFTGYFISSSGLWNFIDVVSSLLVIVFGLIDISGKGAEVARIVGSVAIFLLWMKFFYFLRIFKPTSAFIRMITQIISDMSVFACIYLLAIFAFANAWYVLDAKQEIDGNLKSIAGKKWWQAFIYTYLTGLGEYGLDGYDGNDYELLLWGLFFGCTFLLSIVLLNTLIAIMGDTFGRVKEGKEVAFLREICSLISENRMILDHDYTFGKYKYLTIAKIELADIEGTIWEGKLDSLNKQFLSQAEALEDNLRMQRAVQKDEFDSVI